jgi:hypothetical protein
LFSVRGTAERLLNLVRQPDPDVLEAIDLHLRFEASTGVDCSGFFSGTRLQPLSVAGVVEQFLESPEAAKYKDGVRYFFGHRIPD